MKYRYRYNAGGTARTLQRVTIHLFGNHALDKIGEIRYIKGYRYMGRYNTTHEAVMIKGTKGSIRLGGFCWGYGGEGPRGLVQLLLQLGLPESTAKSIAFDTIRKDCIGVDWIVNKKSWGWDIRHDTKENKVTYQLSAA